VFRYRRSAPGGAFTTAESWNCGATDLTIGGGTAWWVCGDFAGRWDEP
jgi:hypothetical protein